MHSATTAKPKSRSALLAGAALVFFSIAAIVLSLGAPGLGWVLASIILITASLCLQWVGPRIVCLCFAVTVIHFVTFGPLASYSAVSPANVSWIVAGVFDWSAFIVCGVALLMPLWRRRVDKSQPPQT